MTITLQETFDRFLLDLQNREHADPELIRTSEQTFQLFSISTFNFSSIN